MSIEAGHFGVPQRELSLDHEVHALTNETEVQQQIENLTQAVDDFYMSVQEYFDFVEKEPGAGAYARQLLGVAHDQAVEILQDIERLPQQTVLSDPTATKLHRIYTLAVEALEPRFIELVDQQFLEEIDQVESAGDDVIYYSAYEVLSERQREILDGLQSARPEAERRDTILRELVEIQIESQMETAKIPMAVIDCAADVIAEMESVEFDYTTDLAELDKTLADLTGMEQLPKRLDILRVSLRVEMMYAARLYSIGGEMVQEELTRIEGMYHSLADEYRALRLVEVAHIYEARANSFQSIVELMATHKSFYAGRVVAQA